MESGVNEEFLGEDYQNFDVYKENEEHSIGTGKKETGPETFKNKGLFEKIDESDQYKPQTEFNKNEKKLDKKTSFARKGSLAGNSSKNLQKILRKKTNRDDPEPKQKEKRKSEMDITLKNKTEVDKVESEKKIYEMFNNNDLFLEYDEGGRNESDLINLMDNDEAIPDPEVNITRRIYTTQNKFDVQETFNMVLSSNINK